MKKSGLLFSWRLIFLNHKRTTMKRVTLVIGLVLTLFIAMGGAAPITAPILKQAVGPEWYQTTPTERIETSSLREPGINAFPVAISNFENTGMDYSNLFEFDNPEQIVANMNRFNSVKYPVMNENSWKQVFSYQELRDYSLKIPPAPDKLYSTIGYPNNPIKNPILELQKNPSVNLIDICPELIESPQPELEGYLSVNLTDIYPELIESHKPELQGYPSIYLAEKGVTYKSSQRQGNILTSSIPSGTLILDNRTSKGLGEETFGGLLTYHDTIGILYLAGNAILDDAGELTGELGEPFIAIFVEGNHTETITGIPSGRYIKTTILAEDWDPVSKSPSVPLNIAFDHYMSAVNEEIGYPNLFQFIELVVPAYLPTSDGESSNGDDTSGYPHLATSAGINSSGSISLNESPNTAKSDEGKNPIPSVTTTYEKRPDPTKSPIGIFLTFLTYVEEITGIKVIFLLSGIVIISAGIVIAWKLGYIGQE